METILYLAFTNSDGSLPKSALETLSAAVKLSLDLNGSALKVGLIGDQAQVAANSIAGVDTTSFLAVSGPEFNVSRYASDTAAIEALAKQAGATIVIAPATSRFNRSMPGAAFRLGGRIDTHITDLDTGGGEPVVQRWYYRQRMVAKLTREQRPWCLLIEAGVFPAWKGSTGSAEIESIPVKLPETSLRTEVVGIKSPACETETVRPDAKILFVAGAGWMKKQADGETHVKDAEKLILTFLDTTRASLGSSKSLVDQGGEGQEVISFMSHLNQIGQTGSTPRHQKGLATCCHGEEPHVIGWRFINERRAINSDANCGWAQGKADVLYVADAFEVMQRVNELLS